MNGIGANTTIKAITLPLVNTARVIAVVMWVLFAGALPMWILGKNKWKKTEEYLNYKTLKNALKAEKKEK
jgi:hypothetical protein